VSRDHVLELVFVHVRIHPDILLVQDLVILGAWQRRQHEKFERVERQLFLDDLEVVADRLGRVVLEAEDVAGEGHDADPLPLEQHLAVLGDLVLPLLGGDQIRRVDVL
jgi:hypothetical protein